jgi:Zn-dependent protease with chaperone function
MIEGLFHYQVLNIVVNALLAFLTTIFLIELFLKISRFKNPRVTSLIRLIPVLKLPLDIWMADWSRWALLHGISPLECAEGTRMLFIGCSWIDALSNAVVMPVALRIGFELAGGYTFSIIDLLSPLINLGVVRAVSCTLIALTGLKCILLAIKFRRDLIHKREFLKNCVPCYRPVENLLLNKGLTLAGIRIYSHAVYEGSPLLIGSIKPKIIFPESLLKLLDQKEFEAILAHELQHAINKDIFVRGVLDIIKKLFWWIPTKRLISSIELQQELACDQNCSKYKIDPIELASGIVKVAKYSTSPAFCMGVHLFRQSLLKDRIHELLDDKGNKAKGFWNCLANFLGILIIAAILFGRFWIV